MLHIDYPEKITRIVDNRSIYDLQFPAILIKQQHGEKWSIIHASIIVGNLLNARAQVPDDASPVEKGEGLLGIRDSLRRIVEL